MPEKPSDLGFRQFQEDDRWGGSEVPLLRQRLEETIELIPAEARSILDVGCGSGNLVNRLCSDPSRYVVGVDSSNVALEHVRAHRICASGSELPLQDKAFDIVLCCEVLEHLPDVMIQAFVGEMVRVSKRWILVTVPYKEQLLRSFTKCSQCGHLFHVDGHIQSFTRDRLSQIMAPEFKAAETHELTMAPRRHYSKLLTWVEKRLCHNYTISRFAFCPKCGSRGLKQPSWWSKCYVLPRAVNRILNRRRKQQGGHLAILFERVGSMQDADRQT